MVENSISEAREHEKERCLGGRGNDKILSVVKM